MIGNIGATIHRQVIEFRTRGISKASSDLANVGKQANLAAGNFKNLAGAFTGLLVARQISRAISGLVKTFADYQMSLKNLQVLTSANSREMARYVSQVRKVAAESPFGLTELNNSLVQLRKSTGDSAQAVAALRSSAQIAMASFGKLSIDKASDMVGTMARTFGLAGDQIDRAAAKIFAAVKRTGVSVEDFSGTLGRLGMAGIRGGQNFDDLLTTFALTKQIMPGKNMASTQIMRLMGELSKGKKIDQWESAGIQVREGGKVRSITDIMGSLMSRFSQGGAVRQNLMDMLNESIGERSIKSLMAMLTGLQRGIVGSDGKRRTGMDAWVQFQKDMRTDKNALTELADEFKNSLAGSINFAANALERFKVALGSSVSGAASAVLKVATKLMDLFSAILEHPVGKMVFGAGATVGMAGLSTFAAGAAFTGMKKILNVVKHNMLIDMFGSSGVAGVASAMEGGTGGQLAGLPKTESAAVGPLAAAQLSMKHRSNLVNSQYGITPSMNSVTRLRKIRQKILLDAAGVGAAPMAVPLRRSVARREAFRAMAGGIGNALKSSAIGATRAVGGLGSKLKDLVGGPLNAFSLGLLALVPIVREIAKSIQAKVDRARGKKGVGLDTTDILALGFDNASRSWVTKIWKRQDEWQSIQAKAQLARLRVADMERKAAQETKKAASAMLDAGSKFYRDLTNASKTVKSAVDYLQGINSYEQKVFHVGDSLKASEKLRVLAGRVGGKQGEFFRRVTSSQEGFEKLVLASQERQLTPMERTQMSAFATRVYQGASLARNLYGSKSGFTKKGLQKLKDRTSGAALSGQTPEAMKTSHFLASSGGLDSPAGLPFGLHGGFAGLPAQFDRATSQGDLSYLVNLAAAAGSAQRDMDARQRMREHAQSIEMGKHRQKAKVQADEMRTMLSHLFEKGVTVKMKDKEKGPDPAVDHGFWGAD